MSMQTLADRVHTDAEILRLCRSGLSRREVADQMHMSMRRVQIVCKGEPQTYRPPKSRGHGRRDAQISISRPLLWAGGVALNGDDCKWALYRAKSISEGAAAIGVTEEALRDWQERDRAWCEASGLCPRCETLTHGEPCDCEHDAIDWERLDVDAVIAMVGAERLREMFDNSPVMALCEDVRRGCDNGRGGV